MSLAASNANWRLNRELLDRSRGHMVEQLQAAQFFGGTGLVIIVGVLLDFLRQIEAYLLQRHYDGFLKKGRNWLISASGGVQIHPSEVAAKTEKSESLAPMRGQMVSTGDRWWWD